MVITGNRAHWEADTGNIALLDLTIGVLLDQQAASFPDKEALVYDYPELGLNLRWTYRQYLAEVNRLAKGLLALGVKQGEHVAVWSPNVPEWVVLELALAKVGAVLVTVNTHYNAADLEYVLQQGDIATLVLLAAYGDNSYLETVYGMVPELSSLADPVREPVQSARLPYLQRVIVIDTQPHPGVLLYTQVAALGETVSDATLPARQARITPQDVAQMLYTSGTTGFPKAVMLTHHQLINQAHVSCWRTALCADERFVTPMPFFHIGGCLGGVLYALYLGCTLIPMLTFDAAKQLELMTLEQATVTANVPTMLTAMLNHPRFRNGEFALTALRTICTGGAPVPVALLEQVKAEMGAEGTVVFGQTESSGAITQTTAGDSSGLRSTTVGTPHPHMEITIVNPQTGDTVGCDESGELLARGFLVMPYCQAGLSRHHVPRHIVFVTSFPLTGSGKVKKFELRAQLMRELGLAEE